MANAQLKLTVRQEDKNPRQLRSEGILPASVYGKNYPAKSVQLDTHEFELAYKANKDGEWELLLGNDKLNAKIQELQMNYATGEYLNVEFAVV